MAKLTDRQQRFVEEYLIDLNATRAAVDAGYSEKTARSIGQENLTKPDIQEAIQEAQKKRSERTEITQDYVLKSIQETMERCKQAIPVMSQDGGQAMVEDADGELHPMVKFDPSNVLKGAELLGRHLGMFKDKVEHSGKIEISDISDDALDKRIQELESKVVQNDKRGEA